MAFRVVVAELEPCPLVDELVDKGMGFTGSDGAGRSLVSQAARHA